MQTTKQTSDVTAPEQDEIQSSCKLEQVARQIGTKLKNIRLEKRMSQFEVCKLSGIGMTSLSRLEQGRGLPSLTSLLHLARALQTQPAVFLYFELDETKCCGSPTSCEQLCLNRTLHWQKEAKMLSSQVRKLESFVAMSVVEGRADLGASVARASGVRWP